CRHHFCPAPYCSPSRGAMLTGRYPHVNGLMGLVNLGWDLPADNVLLPQALGRLGYRTALIGFQHVAADPARLGYDEISPRGGYGCRQVAPLAVEYIRSRTESDAPFYLEIGFSEVHRPYGGLERRCADEGAVTPLPFLRDTPGLRLDLTMFYESIRRLDDAVGQILRALGEAGLQEETLLVFTTDHGIAFPRAKATLYDPGLRTALLLRWPGGFAGGRVLDALLSSVDLFPTVLELAAGADASPGPVDGRSFAPLLTGGQYEPREAVFAEKNTTLGDAKRAVRTGRHKLIRNLDVGPALALPTDIEVTATRRDLGDHHLRPRPPLELYDLERDPWEQENLAGRSEYEAVEHELSERLERWRADTGDPTLHGPAPRPPAEAEIAARIRSPEAMARRRATEAAIQAEYARLRSGD
ncbi:MAG: sulfatase, partial [Gemmatimonadota bacterium]